MSGIAAVLRFDSRPIEPDMIVRMTEAMAYRGPDGIAHWTGEGAALGHCMFRTTAESLEEVQPLADETGRFHLVMDGWLANPDELRTELESRGVRLRGRSDADLVLRAWLTWREQCCDHIDGEFAFLVWDAQRRSLFAARDHVGLRPLHWHWDGKRLLVASDINGVLAAGDIEARLNPGVVAEHLVFRIRSPDETLWQGVMRLPPANALVVDAAGPRRSRYWLPPLEVTLRYAREEQYHEHYRELLADSVRRASRTHLPLACEVSGGLDSSAVFALARRELLAGRLPAPSLQGYTWSFPPGGSEDESEFADAVADHLGVTLTKVSPYLPDTDWFVERSRADRDMAIYPNVAMGVNIAKAATGDGARVVLNGEGGDNFLGGMPHYFAEHILERDWRSLVRSAREDAVDLGWRETLGNMLRCGIAPLLPGPVRKLRGRLIVSRAAAHPLLSPQLRELHRQRSLDRPTLPLAAPNQRTLFSRLTDPYFAYVCEYSSRECARSSVEARSPMASRAMVEFAFSTPQRLRVRGDMHKHVHREAMVGLLPDMVVRRRTKAHFNFSLERILDKELARVISVFPQCGMDRFVDSVELHRLLSLGQGAESHDWRGYELWAVFGLAVMLQAGQAN
jgi:asparagine synthase (glutamine-hydrolysing)